MIEVYIAPIQQLEPDDLVWKSKVSKERWLKSRRYQRKITRAQAIGAELLINYMLQKVEPELTWPINYSRDAYGKMFLPKTSYHFNISHSGDYVAGAVANVPVGVDIQQCRPISFRMAQRFFAMPELLALENLDEKERTLRLNENWVLKESYVKMLGKGISYLRNGCFLQIGRHIRMNDPNHSQANVFQLWENIPDYRIAICLATSQEPPSTYHLLPVDWFHNFLP